MLPDLSGLGLLPRRLIEHQEDVGLPKNGHLPKLRAEALESSSTWDLDAPLGFKLFVEGAVFSCTGTGVKYYVPDLDDTTDISNILKQLTDDQLYFASGDNRRGGFNQTHKITTIAENKLLNNDPELTTFIMEGVALMKGQYPTEVLVRRSLSKRVYKMLHGFFAGSTKALNDYLFQELFLSLVAADGGFGPEIYYARLTSVIHMDEKNVLHTVPCVVYIMQAAGADIEEACRYLDTEITDDLSKRLVEVMWRAANSKMLLLDIKLQNIVLLDQDNDNIFDEVRLIDFQVDFATVVRSEISINGVMYINAAMLCISVASMIVPPYASNESVRVVEDLVDVLRHVTNLLINIQIEYNNNVEARYKDGSIIHDLQTRKVTEIDFITKYQIVSGELGDLYAHTILDTSDDMSRLASTIFFQANHYARFYDQTNKKMFSESFFFGPTNTFDVNKALFPQLVHSFYASWESKLRIAQALKNKRRIKLSDDVSCTAQNTSLAEWSTR